MCQRLTDLYMARAVWLIKGRKVRPRDLTCTFVPSVSTPRILSSWHSEKAGSESSIQIHAPLSEHSSLTKHSAQILLLIIPRWRQQRMHERQGTSECVTPWNHTKDPMTAAVT